MMQHQRHTKFQERMKQGDSNLMTSVAGSVPRWEMPKETPGHNHSCTKCNLKDLNFLLHFSFINTNSTYKSYTRILTI